MKKRQIWNIIFAVLFLALFVIELVAIIAIARLKMLPGVLVFLIVVVFLAYDCVTASYMFLRGRKVTRKNARQMAKKRRIIACVLSLLMACGCVVVTSVVNDVYRTLQSLQASEKEQEPVAVTRAVYVRTYDKAQTLEETKTYRFGKLIHFDDENTQQAVDAIETQLGGTIQTTGYSSVFDMANALLSGELDALILNKDYVTVLEGESQFAEFTGMTRILTEVEIAGTGENLDSEGLLLNAEVDIAENGKIKPFVVYISGSDSRVNSMQNNRSDVNILVVVNPQTRQILLLNTPRDYYVPSTEVEGAMEKLSHAGVFGVNSSIGSLESLYDQEINYYVQVSFGGLEGLVDAIGGVTVYSDTAFTLYEDVGTIQVGENYLNGKLALAFARTRKGLEGGDLARGNHQMEIIKAVVDKATSGTTIINNYTAIMESLEGLFVMNVPQPLISALVKDQLANMTGWNIVSYSTYGTGGYGEVYSVPGTTVYIIEPDVAAVEKAAKMIDMVMDGETMTEEKMNAI